MESSKASTGGPAASVCSSVWGFMWVMIHLSLASLGAPHLSGSPLSALTASGRALRQQGKCFQRTQACLDTHRLPLPQNDTSGIPGVSHSGAVPPPRWLPQGRVQDQVRETWGRRLEKAPGGGKIPQLVFAWVAPVFITEHSIHSFIHSCTHSTDIHSP